jgi:seryl-tRNA synthetase
MASDSREANMAKSRIKQAAESIGAAMGKADRTAHKVAKAGVVAKQELVQLSKQVESLKRQLQKTTKRLRKALS